MALKRCFIKTLLALIAVCAFIACTNPSDNTEGGTAGGGNTPSVPEVPAPGQIRIMITGDERVDPYKSYIDTAKDTVWSAALKTQIEAKFALKTEWQGGDYGVYACKLGNGKTLTDGHTFAQDTVVYVVTNYTKFRINGTVLEGYTSGHEPRGRIIIPDGVTEIKEGAFQNCRNLTGTLGIPHYKIFEGTGI